MARAYLKIFVDSFEENGIVQELNAIDGVKTVDLTMGEQDIIAVVEAETFDDIVQIVLGEVRQIKGVSRTITNLAIPSR